MSVPYLSLTALSEEVRRHTEKRALQEKEVRRLETQAVLLARIRDLEAERRHLEDGLPCPLCGATEHPFAAGNIPAIDDAEAALAGLQQEGKLIDVISHVPALKERIATQIQVVREAGGRSRIVGPGCRRVNGTTD